MSGGLPFDPLVFAHPEWLPGLGAALAAALLGLGFAQRRAQRRLQRLLGPRARLSRRARAGDLALFVALAALALALLGPRIGERAVRVPASGVDVVLLLDVSRSMAAADVPPSRLDRARRAAEGLLERLAPGDRAALAAFAGAGVLLTPLTPDREVLSELLGGLDTRLLAPASSDLGAGLRTALEAFERGSERPRVVVLLSDGEDPERRPAPSAGALARSGVRVVAAAFGSDAGALLPDHGVPLVDRWGRTVVSRRDAARLEEVAAATDGALWRADAWGEVELDALVAAVRRDAGGASGEEMVRRVPAVRVLPFALAAFAILLLEGGSPRPRTGRGGRRRALAGVSVALLGLALPAVADAPPLALLEARVRERPEDAAALVALGAARLERGQRESAARAFLAAAVHARDPGRAAVAYHDLGVVALEQGDLEAARAAFLDALALAPEDAPARFNLEWTLRTLEERDPPPPRPEPEDAPPPPAAAPPDPEPAPGTRRDRSLREPSLDPQAQQRLLDRIEDEPARALRAATRHTRRRPGAGTPVW